MKILMVNKFLYPNGGSETYMFKLGKYLTSIGHQVEYFGMEHPDRCVSNSADCYTENMDFHNSSAVKKVLMSLKTIYSSEARKKIRKVLETFQPDIVHLNNFNYQLTPSIILEIRKWEKDTGKRVKIIYTAHDYQLICPNHMFNNPNTGENCEKCINGSFINCIKGKCVHGSTLKSAIGYAEAVFWNSKNVYSNIDAIICCSNFMKSKLDTNPVLKSKTVALHNFVDIDKIEQLKTDKQDYFLYFGRFSWEKGIEVLLNACSSLPEIKFIFAGNGPMEDEVNKVTNIENVGFQSWDNLKNLIVNAKASICPSICYENCPMSVMESISLGTLVIGAEIGGIPELIENGTNGLLFKAGNSQDLKSKISMTANNEKLTKSLADGCRGNRFLTIEEYTNKYFSIINNCNNE